jgi:hypothetical protein
VLVLVLTAVAAEQSRRSVLHCFGDDLEHFQAKRIPVRVKKMRQNKNLGPRSDSIGTEKALARIPFGWNHPNDENTRHFNELEHVHY